jgi:hypothetical protein
VKLRSVFDQLMKHPKAAVYIPSMDQLWNQLSDLSAHLLSSLLERRHPYLVILIMLTKSVDDLADETLVDCPLISKARNVALVSPNQVNQFLLTPLI